MGSDYLLKLQMLEARGKIKPKLRFAYCNTCNGTKKSYSLTDLMDFEARHKGHSIDYRT